MILYFNSSNNDLMYANIGNSVLFAPNTNVVFVELKIDEVLGNKDLIIDVLSSLHKKDVSGNTKYYIDSGDLHERDGWKEHIEGES